MKPTETRREPTPTRVKMSWEQISSLLLGEYTAGQVAEALWISRKNLLKNGYMMPQTVLENPYELVRLIKESERAKTKPSLKM